MADINKEIASENEKTSDASTKTEKAKGGGGTIVLFLFVLLVLAILIGQKVTGEPFIKVTPYNPEHNISQETTIPENATFIGDTSFFVA